MDKKTGRDLLGIKEDPFESACPGYPSSEDDFLRTLYEENGMVYDPTSQRCTGTLIHEEEMRERHFQKINEKTRKIQEENFKLYSPIIDYIFENGPITINQIHQKLGGGEYIETGVALMSRAGYLKRDKDGRFSTSKSMANEFYKDFEKQPKF